MATLALDIAQQSLVDRVEAEEARPEAPAPAVVHAAAPAPAVVHAAAPAPAVVHAAAPAPADVRAAATALATPSAPADVRAAATALATPPAGRDRPSGATLDDLIAGAWTSLTSARTAACPVCAADLTPRYGAGAQPVAGSCRSCGAELA